jgi:hypothetical protein
LEPKLVVGGVAALLHERPNDVIEGGPEVGDHVGEDHRQLQRWRLLGDQPNDEPARGIGSATNAIRHRGEPPIEGLRECDAVLLGACVLCPECVETIHSGSLPPPADHHGGHGLGPCR